MHPEPIFPSGLTYRGASHADIRTVANLLRASEEFDAGEAITTVEDVESEWMLPGFDPTLDTLLVSEGATAVAYAEVPGWRAEATVHPDARRRGIGTALLAWIELRAIQRATSNEKIRVGQTVIDTDEASIALFLRHGYSERHTSWVLRLPRDETIDEPTLPNTITIRPFDPAREKYAAYRVIEDAFNEWPTRVPSSFDDWQSSVTMRADFDPTLLLVAVVGEDVVGVAFGLPYEEEGWVQQIAVRREYRGQGLGKALLRASFEEFRRRGFPEVGLSTDSRTGALDLYLSVGMVVRASYTHYSKVLTPQTP